MTPQNPSRLKSSLLTATAIAAVLVLGSSFLCVHEYLPEQLSSNPGLYSSAFVLVP